MKKLRLCSPAKAVRVMNGNATGDGNSTEIGAPPQGYAAAGKLMLGTIVALFLVVVAALFIHHYLQMAILRRIAASRRRRWRSGDETLNPSASPGLDPAVLESIPAVAVAGLKGEEGIECAVCLSEAAVGEMVRILPRCGHGFHVDCIDLWFGSHETCPVCRAPVEVVAPPPATEIDGLGSSRGAAAKGSVSGGLRRFGGAAPATPAAEPPDLEREEVAERC